MNHLVLVSITFFFICPISLRLEKVSIIILKTISKDFFGFVPLYKQHDKISGANTSLFSLSTELSSTLG
jgi:hypothetical protein